MEDKYDKCKMLGRSSEAEATPQVLRYFYRSKELVIDEKNESAIPLALCAPSVKS
jgi:hypothetical protein